MKLEQLYNFILEEGAKNDPRQHIKKYTYPDTAILFGNLKGQIKNIMVGIDIGVAEVLLADRLRKNGRQVDLILVHHPLGIAQTNYASAMNMQTDLLHLAGFSKATAKKLNKPDMKKIRRNLYLTNYNKVVDAARLLNIPLICAHTPVDNLVWSHLNNHLQRAKRLGDVIDLLLKLPEYRHASQIGLPPTIIKGRTNDKVGKFWIDMTGANPLPSSAIRLMKNIGIDTVVAMHLFEETFKELNHTHINYIVCGHMASDSLGLNLLLKKLSQKTKFKVIPCGGFWRIL